MFRIFLLLTLVPFLELVLIFRIHGHFAQRFGADMAFMLSLGSIVLTGVVGAALARSQGTKMIRKVQEKSRAGEVPTSDLLQGLLILIGGILLLTPGYMTDAVGLLMILPFSRPLIARYLQSKIKKGIASGNVVFWSSGPPYSRSAGQGRGARAARGPVIDVDYEDHSEK